MNCNKLFHQSSVIYRSSNIRNFFTKRQKTYKNGRRNVEAPIRVQVSTSKITESAEKLKSTFKDSQPLKVPHGFKGIMGRVAFAFGFSGCCYVGACIWHYERNKSANRFGYRPWEFQQKKFSEIRESLNQHWKSISNGEKALYTLVALNGFVYLVWLIRPNGNSLLLNYFICSQQTKYSSMIFSAFSHMNFLHLAANMYVLRSFMSPTVDRFLGIEQFAGLYLSAAVLSNCASLVFKAVVSTPFVFSLGASGAICTLLAYACSKIPNERLMIIFLPFINFRAEDFIKYMIAFESACLFLPARFRYFDHAAHLGGLLFGIWYAKYGENLLWRRLRFDVVKYWIDLKGR